MVSFNSNTIYIYIYILYNGIMEKFIYFFDDYEKIISYIM